MDYYGLVVLVAPSSQRGYTSAPAWGDRGRPKPGEKKRLAPWRDRNICRKTLHRPIPLRLGNSLGAPIPVAARLAVDNQARSQVYALARREAFTTGRYTQLVLNEKTFNLSVRTL